MDRRTGPHFVRDPKPENATSYGRVQETGDERHSDEQQIRGYPKPSLFPIKLKLSRESGELCTCSE
jgi:hypothetical protein